MIKLLDIHIEEFRGIKKLFLELDGENFAVKGANGSGKSGVIDAIEFALTGNITRLSGAGSGGLSLKMHAPHVDIKDTPGKAKVIVNVSLSTGKKFKIERTVSQANKPIIDPEDRETIEAFNYINSHSEFSLSRREILKFVLTEASSRAKEVQSLLKLDSIDKNRAAFQTAFNSSKKEYESAKISYNRSRLELVTHLKIPDLIKEHILAAVNERRKILSLVEIQDLTADTKFSDGILSGSTDPKKTISRAQSLKAVNDLVSKIQTPIQEEVVDKAIESLEQVLKTPELLTDLSKQRLYEMGILFVEGDECPLCEDEWSQEELLSHLRLKIESNKKAQQNKNSVDLGIAKFLKILRELSVVSETLKKDCDLLSLEEDSQMFSEAIEKLRNCEKKLSNPFEDINQTISLFRNISEALPKGYIDSINNLKRELEELPDLTTVESAKQFLIIADEKVTSYRQFRIEEQRLQIAFKAANEFLTAYSEISEQTLKDLYSYVQIDFATFYKRLNSEDEAGFSALLVPQGAGLNLDVDFYGRGQFPPNAYHSEGHQDSMGLCLYLALVKKLMAQNFSICLLDDVLMSVDSGHRREVCKLLSQEFSNTQFILTTHDEVWAKQLVIEGLIKSKKLIQFRGWTVDAGPGIWDLNDIWEEINFYLKGDQIEKASHSLRRYLEFFFTEMAYKLRAKIEARPTASFDLGEIAPAVIEKIKDLYRKGKEAGNSWNQKDVVEEIGEMDQQLGMKYKTSNIEQWAVNASVHYNEWASLSKEDFKSVLKSFEDLIKEFRCQNCNSWLFVTPSKGNIESLRCDCSKININLKKK